MTHMPSFTQFFGRALMVSGVALLCFSASAHAGFEWRGPIEPPVRQTAPAPVTGNDMSGLAPITAWDGAVQPAHDAPAAVVESVEAEPVSPALKPFAAAPAAHTAPQTMPVEGEVLAGFGRDLPLVIALQQVAPAGHQFSFASGVNPGAVVSWEGGKPWQAVMTDMLAPQGLEYQLQGNVVAVGHATGGAVAPAPVDTTMSQMPSDTAEAPAAVDVAAPAAATAAAAPSSEPVTIRRQRPVSAASADNRTAGSQPSVNTPAKAASVPAAAAAMSYPPETAGSRPVAVNSVPPAATKQLSQAPVSEAPADLSTPPAMDTMSPAPEAAADIKTDGVEVAPAAVVEAPTPLVDKAAKPTDAKVDAKAEAKPAVAAATQKAGEPWAGTKGATLRDTLESWSLAAGVELYWSIDYDYKLKGNVKYDGSYDEAVGQLLDQFASVRPQPYGQLHQGKDGPRVLIVKSYDLAQ